MKQFKEWRQYKEPQAHHWIIVRLIVDGFLHGRTYSYNDERARSVIWLVKELGAKRVSEMMSAIKPDNNPANPKRKS